jgi:transcriptional regulator with PAS, ATPase and Fis domain
LINASAIEDIVCALEEGQPTLNLAHTIRFSLAVQALQDGASLAEIVRCAVGQVEQHIIHQVLVSVQGNKSEAARLLRIDYKTLYRKMRKYADGLIVMES